SIYYAGKATEDSIRSDLPAGTYAPEFSHVTHAPGPESPVVLPASAQQRRRRWPLVLALSAVVAAALVFAWIKTRPSSSAVDQFWSPVLGGSSPVLVCASFVPVWAPNPRITNDQPTRFEDFVHLTDQFVGGGDLLAA